MKFISGGFAVWQFSVASALQSTVVLVADRGHPPPLAANTITASGKGSPLHLATSGK